MQNNSEFEFDNKLNSNPELLWEVCHRVKLRLQHIQSFCKETSIDIFFFFRTPGLLKAPPFQMVEQLMRMQFQLVV